MNVKGQSCKLCTFGPQKLKLGYDPAMKILTPLLILSCLVTSESWGSINPEKSIFDFLHVFSSRNKVLSDGSVEMQQKKYNENGNLSPSGERYHLSAQDYAELMTSSKAVFEVEPKDPREGEMVYKGTAFHIGNSLVLTNLHVLSREFTNLTKCDKFRIKDHAKNYFSCGKVHYCNKSEDVCLIEMQSRKFGNLFRPQVESFSSQASLKIENKSYQNDEQIILTSIGNSQGLGIHASQGRGLNRVGNAIHFYASVRDGNSGGPVVHSNGNVIGIVRRESQLKVGNSAYNIAAPTSVAIELIREALKSDPATLEKFNQAVIE